MHQDGGGGQIQKSILQHKASSGPPYVDTVYHRLTCVVVRSFGKPMDEDVVAWAKYSVEVLVIEIVDLTSHIIVEGHVRFSAGRELHWDVDREVLIGHKKCRVLNACVQNSIASALYGAEATVEHLRSINLH
jgi:hypothetical protein